VAKIFYKSSDYRFEFLQSLLLNLHYSRAYANRKVGIKELLEFNVGGEYYNMCRDLGYGSIFTGNKMLPQNLQTQSINIGIDKKGNKSISIVNRLEEMLIDTAGMIDSLEFWTQLKTFVRKGTATGYKYEPENKKIHFDDEIDSEVYAKINVDAHSHIPVIKEDEGVEERQHAKKLRYYYDEHGNLSLGTLSKAAAAKRAFNGIHSQ
jgi:hypothetical protein